MGSSLEGSEGPLFILGRIFACLKYAMEVYNEAATAVLSGTKTLLKASSFLRML